MYIAVFESEEWEAQACNALHRQHRVACTPEALAEETAARFREADVISTFVNSRLTADVLRVFPNLRLVATRSTGYDHIDLPYCAAAGVSVANVPSYGEVTVAEHVFALLLALSRKLPQSLEQARQGRFEPSELRGMDLCGKTLGVVGTGRIGRHVIQIARGFGMRVVANDRQPDLAFAKAKGFHYAELATLLAEADVVSLHVPATASTAGMIGEAEFAAMKRDAILINTARGNVVDVAALVRALSDGQINAAGLDVLPHEPLMRDEAEIFRSTCLEPADMRQMLANHVLMTMPNVIVTPHNAYNTVEARGRIIATTIANIEAFAAGRPANIVS